MRIRDYFISPRGDARFGGIAALVALFAVAIWIESCALFPLGRASGEDILKFSHGEHEGFVSDCNACHFNEETQEFAAADHNSCVSCHAAASSTAEPDRSCTLCHHSPSLQTVFKTPRPDYGAAEFYHPSHGQVDCATCHGDVTSTSRFATIDFPRMEDCLKCHEPGLGEVATATCILCHSTISPTTLPENHRQPAWSETMHGPASRLDENLCARCHVKADDCEICHSRIEPLSHTPSFSARTHGFFAVNNPLSCQTCHTQDFCEACHRTTEPLNHTASFTGQPFLHCATCHLPLEPGNRCSVCHQGDPHAAVIARPPPPALVAAGAIDPSGPCLPCHPVAQVPITHPYNSITPFECVQCHRPVNTMPASDGLQAYLDDRRGPPR